jgi:hypothetical protein
VILKEIKEGYRMTQENRRYILCAVSMLAHNDQPT